jgi:hypothetical protein
VIGKPPEKLSERALAVVAPMDLATRPNANLG